MAGGGGSGPGRKRPGRWYRVTGGVIHGDGRGRTIGIPTANVDLWPQRALPANGVYAVYGWVDGKRWPGVANIGVRPTFETQPTLPVLKSCFSIMTGISTGR